MPSVLVVDDSPTDRLMAGRFLQQEPDVTVSFACDGNEALEHIRKEHPDAVVTDLQMPECDGLQLVDAVRREFPRLPVILMTAQGSEEIAAEALRRGAASYVPKRALSNQLRDTVARILSAAMADGLQSRLMHSLVHGHLRFEIQNDPDVIDSLTAHLQEMLRCLPLGDEAERLRTGIAVKHAIVNGHYHGNLELPFEIENLKAPAVGDLIRERGASLPYAQRQLIIEADISPREARFQIRHEGPGFPEEQCAAPENDLCSAKHFAQGVLLMRTVMNEVEFAEEGRLVRLLKLPTMDSDSLVAE